jgi:hypothetical protein
MNNVRKFIIPLIVAAQSASAWAWVRPAVPTQIGTRTAPSRSDDVLDYIVVDVNGVSRIVKNGQELAIVRGDALRIKEAVLRNQAISPKEVLVVGLMRSHQGRADVRGLLFHTKDLASRLSEDGKGQVYAVGVRSKKILHGMVYVNIREATLRYAEVFINDTRRILRDGETLRLSAKDMFKLNKVVTNLDRDDGVVFQIAEGSHGGRAIRFLRHGVAFATIPLIIQE